MPEEVTRAEISIGSSATHVWRLTDGSYQMLMGGAAEAIGETSVDLIRFLRSQEFKFLTGNRYANHTWNRFPVPTRKGGEIEVEALPLEAVAAYWLSSSYHGNNKALALCMALINGKLEQSLDHTFGVTRHEPDSNQAWSNRASDIEQALYAQNLNLDDELLRRVRSYEYWFKISGLNPNEPPPYLSYKQWHERSERLLDELEPFPQRNEGGALTGLSRILPRWLRGSNG
ncbi:hypothetical protein NDI52_32315 [Leptolyngbya sp. PL-A3]|uniref:hypothetical protein n=1 Tax=Leptolyngbya sp. PL-A3 TaxID=2933911 RepID=UPI0032977BA8